jgi:hypothetical protein
MAGSERVGASFFPVNDMDGQSTIFRFAPSSRVIAKAEVMSCDMAGGGALLDVRTNIYYGVNEVGSHVWNLIQESKSVEDIRDAICALYDVDREQCAQDLDDLLGRLHEAGLIGVADE